MLCVDKKYKFDLLVENVTRCCQCERMSGRYKVLSRNNGSLDAKVLFIGEAPGRLGADRTLIPFYGDQTGKNFERLLKTSGLTRKDIFITNAVLCNPRDEKGNNATPNKDEVWKCSLYLSLVIEIIKPELIVTLGQCALNALNTIEPHSIELKQDVSKPIGWSRYAVLPMYHPGPRALVHRNLANQTSDFLILNEIIDPSKPENKCEENEASTMFELDPFRPSLAHKIINSLVKQLKTASKFKIAKLLYLLDWRELETNGKLLTGYYYIFQKNGPLATGLTKTLTEMEGHEISFRWVGNTPTYVTGPNVRANMDLPPDINGKVETLLEKYGKHTDSEIKTSAYLTKPMKNIIRRMNEGESFLNQPVFQIDEYKIIN
jgi:uracil-DNA glycosylase family 4